MTLVAFAGCALPDAAAEVALVSHDENGWHVRVPTDVLRRSLRRTSALPEASVHLKPGDGDPGFATVSYGGLLSADRAFVVAAHENRVVVFDKTGRAIRSVGRRGDGPGEFRGMDYAVVTPGDSIVVSDWTHRRITVFDHGDSVVLALAVGAFGVARPVRPVTVLANGDILGFMPLPLPSSVIDGIVRQPVRVLRLSLQQRRADSVREFGAEEINVYALGGKRVLGTPRFQRTTFLAPHAGGFALLDNAGTTLRVFDAGGAPIGTVEMSLPIRAVTESECGREKTRIERGGNPPAIKARILAGLRCSASHAAIPGPPHWDGNAWWIPFGNGPADVWRWIGVTPSGEVYSGPRTPPGKMIVAIRDGRALVLSEDHDGFQVAHVHAMPGRRQ